MKIIEPQSKEQWESYYNLRFRVLREPWNEPRGSERDDSDATSVHRMVADDSDRCIAVSRLHYNSPTEGQIRFMAVDNTQQSKGVGSYLLNAMEEIAIAHGCNRMILEAREPAIPFYQRNGYIVFQRSYLLFGCIQHYTMFKDLSSVPRSASS